VHQAVLIAPLGGVHSQSPTPFARLMQKALGLSAPPLDTPASAIVVFPTQAGPVEVRAAVDRAIDERGARYLKFYDQAEKLPSYQPGAAVMNSVQLEAAADQARKRGVVTTMHHATAEGLLKGARAGVTSLVHLPLDRLLTPSEARACAAAGCIVEPTLTVGYCMSWPKLRRDAELAWAREWLPRLDAYRSATYEALMEMSWVEALRPLALAMRTRLEQGRTRMAGVVEMGGAFRYWSPMLVQGVANLRLLWDAGITLACGTDAGAVPVAEGMIGLELGLLRLSLNTEGEPVRFGAADALRAATLHGARALGLEHEAGTLAPGKVADLVVLEGDPLAEPDLVGSLAAAVAKAGVWL
jgi:imidazolonepropionase-like amidohydrolase